MSIGTALLWSKGADTVWDAFKGKGDAGPTPAAPAPVEAVPTGRTREQRIAEEYARKRAAFEALNGPSEGTLGQKSLLGNA